MLVGDAKNGSPTFLFAFGNNIAVDTGSVEILCGNILLVRLFSIWNIL